MRTLLALCAALILASPPAQAQVGALYRCPAGEYTKRAAVV